MTAMDRGASYEKSDGKSTRALVSGLYRIFQLVVGIAAVTMVANLQYGWTTVRRADR